MTPDPPDIQIQIADLRVHVQTLVGKLDLLNERQTNTNTALENLDKTLRQQARQAAANRKWIIGTFLSSVSIVLAILAVFVKMG